RDVTPLAHDDRMDEVLMEMIDEFDHSIVHAPGYGDEIEHRQMLHQLAQADTAGMRTDRHAEFRRHQDDRQVFIDAAETAAVDLTEINRARLQKLFEDHAVGAVFTGRDADRADRLRDLRVPE